MQARRAGLSARAGPAVARPARAALTRATGPGACTQTRRRRTTLARYAQQDVAFEGVSNWRDLAEASARIRPGCVFRSAAPVNATPRDMHLLFGRLGVKDLLDLRSSEETALDFDAPAFDGLHFYKYGRDSHTNRVVPDTASFQLGDPERGDVTRAQIAVMEKGRYYLSLISRMRKRDALRLVATRIVDEAASRRLAVRELNRGGLEGLYRVLLEDSYPELVAGLRHIANAVRAGRPCCFFCRAGKDRTGLLAALLLSVLGASEQEILEDYERSDAYHMVALAGIEDDAKYPGLDRAQFERAPRHVMAASLGLIRASAGGVSQYLVQSGFALAEQEELRALLLQPQRVALRAQPLSAR